MEALLLGNRAGGSDSATKRGEQKLAIFLRIRRSNSHDNAHAQQKLERPTIGLILGVRVADVDLLGNRQACSLSGCKTQRADVLNTTNAGAPGTLAVDIRNRSR